jgi:hypothetical protein
MSIFTALYDLNSCFSEHDIDPSAVGILLKRDDFERMREAVTRENPAEGKWNDGPAFRYAGLTFLDAGAWVYARAH